MNYNRRYCNGDKWSCECDAHIAERDEAVDRWEAKRPEREQAARERLDSQGYYDPCPDCGGVCAVQDLTTKRWYCRTCIFNHITIGDPFTCRACRRGDGSPHNHE